MTCGSGTAGRPRGSVQGSRLSLSRYVFILVLLLVVGVITYGRMVLITDALRIQMHHRQAAAARLDELHDAVRTLYAWQQSFLISRDVQDKHRSARKRKQAEERLRLTASLVASDTSSDGGRHHQLLMATIDRLLALNAAVWELHVKGDPEALRVSTIEYRSLHDILLGLITTLHERNLVALSEQSSRRYERLVTEMLIGTAALFAVAFILVVNLFLHRRTERALLASEQRYRNVIQSTADAVLIVNNDGAITAWNPSARCVFGYEEHETIGHGVSMLFTEERIDQDMAMIKRVLGGETTNQERLPLRTKQGKTVITDTSFAPILDGTGRIRGLTSVIRDVTERVRMQERLRQSEKMEAIGQLAGGIAHDFNNQLSGILGFADLLHTELAADPELASYAEYIITGVKRSSTLTTQLLAFARKGKYLTESVDAHKIVREVVTLLERTIEKKIALRRHLDASPCVTQGDPAQLQNAVLNLAINARDAMPEGGEICFNTAVVTLDRQYCAHSQFDLQPGRFVRLSVTDTGVGIAREVQHRIFEPFFTTKEPGRGTGMGLAAVYGTVKSHAGAVSVYSEPGKGSTFNLYLPLSPAVENVESTVETPLRPIRCEGRVFVVDDEPLVRMAAVSILKRLGCSVITADDGREAVACYAREWDEIDLVILDLVMPQMDGRDTFRAMRDINPAVKVLLSSGFSINGEAQQMLDQGALGFIQKPFRAGDLGEKVRSILGWGK